MKNTQTFFLICALLLITSFSIAQSNSDFQGSWYGTNKAGQTVELQLNTSMSCVLKINNTPSYNISAYRLYDDRAVADSSSQGPARGIRFYLNSNASISSAAVVVSGGVTVPPPVTFYIGNLDITDPTLFTKMHLSFSLSPSSPLIEFDLHR